MAKTSAGGRNDEDVHARAARLVERSFVLNATEAPVSAVDGKHVMNFTGLAPLEGTMIEDWRRQGYDALLIPQGFLDPANMCPVADPLGGAMHVFGRWSTFVAEHADELMLITARESFDRAWESGRIGFLVGTYNAGELFRTVDDVDLLYHEVGLRHVLLTCFGQNRLGTSADEGEGRDDGLTRYGRAVIERMNALGMAADVSHCGLETRREAGADHARQRGGDLPLAAQHLRRDSARHGGQRRCDRADVLAAHGARRGAGDHRGRARSLRSRVPAHRPAARRPRSGDADGRLRRLRERRRPGAAGVVSRERASMDIPELCGHDRIRTRVGDLIHRDYGDEDITGILGGNFVRAFKEIFAA